MGKFFVDTTPLRLYPEFRRVWIGAAVSAVGSQLAVVAVAYQVYRLTHSSLDVGLISLVQLGPSLVGSVLGGSIADAFDRRRLLLFTGSTMAVVSCGLALNAARHHPSLLLIYVLAGANAALQGVDGPARQALLISIVERELLISANALRQLIGQVSQVLGPSLGGILLAAFGVEIVFFLNAGSFVVAVGAVLTVGAHPPLGGATRFGLRSIAEGFQFLKGRQAIQGCFIADLNATILGMPTALFPALATVQFHGGAGTVGLLYAAPGAGAVVASAFSGWTRRIRRPGYAVCVAIVCWGVALTAFGFARQVVLAFGLLAIAGGADVISAVFRSTIIQTETPDRLRGRLTSIQLAVVQSGPRLGNAEAGLVAAASSNQLSVVSGGLGCIVGIAIVARLMPRFIRYELGRDEHETAAQPRGA
ncbi:MAG TPA: MFS transporter [Acidimicrobiales bacterium]|nr:MFS transporter [Acidimicrobiales bacterium]